MLTKKYYIKIGKILADSEGIFELVDKLCKFFKEDNPRFDEEKFKDSVFKKLQQNQDAWSGIQ